MKRKEEIRTHMVTGICLVLSMLFIYTAVSKMLHLDTFRFQLEKMPYIKTYASLLYLMVPILELVISGLLLFTKYRMLALYTSLTLLFLFTGYIGFVLRFSDTVPCSCGGVLSSLGWIEHIIFNFLFMVLCLWAIVLHRKIYRLKTL